MDNQFFGSIFSNSIITSINISSFLICMFVSIVLGVLMAKIYAIKTKCTQSFILALAVLPLAVSMVIIMVNGNIGAGVAVAGAFSLVRFRSVPGTAKEIVAVFTAMCTGLTIGMGFIVFAILFSVIACVFTYLLDTVRFGEDKNASNRTLQITVPESLNYTNIFDDIFVKFTEETKLISVKTTNMGSLFKLSYEIKLNDISEEKQFIDRLRERNGNLEISIAQIKTNQNEL